MDQFKNQEFEWSTENSTLIDDAPAIGYSKPFPLGIVEGVKVAGSAVNRERRWLSVLFELANDPSCQCKTIMFEPPRSSEYFKTASDFIMAKKRALNNVLQVLDALYEPGYRPVMQCNDWLDFLVKASIRITEAEDVLLRGVFVCNKRGYAGLKQVFKGHRTLERMRKGVPTKFFVSRMDSVVYPTSSEYSYADIKEEDKGLGANITIEENNEDGLPF